MFGINALLSVIRTVTQWLGGVFAFQRAGLFEQEFSGALKFPFPRGLEPKPRDWRLIYGLKPAPFMGSTRKSAFNKLIE
jgi:hypothetical protein